MNRHDKDGDLKRNFRLEDLKTPFPNSFGDIGLTSTGGFGIVLNLNDRKEVKTT